MDAVRALDIVLKQERLLHGEPVADGVNVRVDVQPTVGPPPPPLGELKTYMMRLMEVAQQQGLMLVTD
jgi:hypothetical protein